MFGIKGQLLILKGVNRHENRPRTGRCVDEETMLFHTNWMKQCNVNVVRNSHYPYWIRHNIRYQDR